MIFSLFVGSVSNVSAATPAKNEAIIKTATAVVGTPYKWGGTTTKGFDCSGFLQYSFSKNGVKVPRTVSELYKKGTYIKKDKLQKGDVVFFQTYKKGPSHAGIYLGQGKFIHSSSSKGIEINTLSSSYWKPRFLGGKRL